MQRETFEGPEASVCSQGSSQLGAFYSICYFFPSMCELIFLAPSERRGFKNTTKFKIVRKFVKVRGRQLDLLGTVCISEDKS